MSILRSWLTLALFVLFILLIIRVFSKKRKSYYQDAANMIFDEKQKKGDAVDE
ncbi:MAG: cbb3-type cytochrome c oxidase subunit 3 [Pseudomonadota bacterium]